MNTINTKEVINYFYAGYNFLGFLVYNSQEGLYQFGYDANADEPRYHVENFTSLDAAYTYLEEHHPDYR